MSAPAAAAAAAPHPRRSARPPAREPGEGHPRQDRAARAPAVLASPPGARAARGHPRHRQDHAGQGAGGLQRLRLQAHPVHPRPAAQRHPGHRVSSTRARGPSASSRGPSSPTSSSPTESTAPRRAPSRRCWRRSARQQVTGGQTHLRASALPVHRHPEPHRVPRHLPAAPKAQLAASRVQLSLGTPPRPRTAILAAHRTRRRWPT
jgi:hypothetical protein